MNKDELIKMWQQAINPGSVSKPIPNPGQTPPPKPLIKIDPNTGKQIIAQRPRPNQ